MREKAERREIDRSTALVSSTILSGGIIFDSTIAEVFHQCSSFRPTQNRPYPGPYLTEIVQLRFLVRPGVCQVCLC